jgi:peptide/nickel transport system permease protein
MRSLGADIVRRLAMLMVVVLATFLLFQVLPGDAARSVLGPTASEAAVAELRHTLGLDASLLTRAGRYFSGLLRFDLGRSILTGRDVTAILAERFAITGKVAALGALLSLATSYVLVLVAQVARITLPARLAQLGTLLPSFAICLLSALLLALVAPGIRFGGKGILASVVIPAGVASIPASSMLTSVLAGAAEAVAAADFVRALRAQGFSRMAVFHRAILRGAAVPWLTAWANQASIVLVGTLVVEIAFTIPGVGTLLVSSIEQRDFPVVGGMVLMNALIFTALWTGVVILQRRIDPRMAPNV